MPARKTRFSRIAAALAVLMVLPLLFSCANTSEAPADATATETTVEGAATDAPTEEVYNFPTENFNGEELGILNYSNTWDFHSQIEFEEQTGEALDDAIYNRNLYISEKFNLKLKEYAIPMETIESKARNTILAGDDIYDLVFLPGSNSSNIGALAIQDSFYDLNKLAALNLSKAWWDQAITHEGVIAEGSPLYFASNDIQMANLQGAWVLYFNEAMMQRLGLDKPYDLVRQGKWTLAELRKYMKAAANMNGADNWTVKLDSPQTYGLTSYNTAGIAFLIGAGGRFVGKNSDGMPILTADSQRFTDACQFIGEMLGIKGDFLDTNDYASGLHYEYMFRDGRALFCAGEIKAATTFRAMDDTFGLVPNPKFDEAQPQYITMQFRQSPVVAIPVTNQNPEGTAAVLDALAYVSHRDVTPVFYDVTVSQKRLRNEESIEMLKLIRETRFFDAGLAYGWTGTLHDTIRDALAAGKTDMVSTVEKNRSKVEAAIAKTLEAMGMA